MAVGQNDIYLKDKLDEVWARLEEEQRCIRGSSATP